MRIAILGSHATGKSTLVAELARRLTDYTTIDEPFYIIEDEGHVFGDPPSTEDFELLFDRSVSVLQEVHAIDVLFDRSPADYLAYMTALDPALVSADHIEAATTALTTLDLVVFVPIERPDRVDVADAPQLRRRVNRILHEMLVDDRAGFDVRVTTVWHRNSACGAGPRVAGSPHLSGSLHASNIIPDMSTREPRFTLVVTGASGAGKTAAVRALAARALPGVACFHFDTIGVPSPEVMLRDFGSGEAWQAWATNQWLDRLERLEPTVLVAVLDAQTRPSVRTDVCGRTYTAQPTTRNRTARL